MIDDGVRRALERVSVASPYTLYYFSEISEGQRRQVAYMAIYFDNADEIQGYFYDYKYNVLPYHTALEVTLLR